MANEHRPARYHKLYARLLRLYPRPYRERFGKAMEQAFEDLCRERRGSGEILFGFVIWMFVETSVVIIQDSVAFMIMQSTKRCVVLAIVAALILAIALAL